jgi:hypothetical protein
MKSTASSVLAHLFAVVVARASTPEGGNQKTGVRGPRAIHPSNQGESHADHFPEYSGRELTLAFPAMVDGERVECMITAEALEDHFGAASPRLEDMVGAFAEHRARIEAATRRLLSETRAQCLVLRSGYVRFYEANWRN